MRQRLTSLHAQGAPALDGQLGAAVAELVEEAGQLRAVEEEITGYAEAALAQTELLKRDNEELRKAVEDAALDK